MLCLYKIHLRNTWLKIVSYILLLLQEFIPSLCNTSVLVEKMSVINILLTTTTNRQINITLSTNFSREEFTKAVSKVLQTPIDDLRFLLDGK